MTDKRDLVMKANLERALQDPLFIAKITELEWLSDEDISALQFDLSLANRRQIAQEAKAEINRLFSRFDIFTKGMS